MENQMDAIARILGVEKKKNHTGKANPNSVNRHTWSIAEENLVIDLYLNKANENDIINAISKTKLKLNSVKMKLQNIAFLDTGEGLENVSELTRTLWNRRK